MTKIYYNNQDIFNGLAPTPLVQINEEPIYNGNLWAIAETIVLNGEITGQCETFQQLLNKQNSLISGFSSQFKSLQIKEGASTIYTWPICKVLSVDFDQSVYSQILPFTVSLECYDSDKFSGYYGVLDPVNKIDYQEEDNGFVTLNHTCSARGITTETDGTKALLNAKNYVSTVSGWSNISSFVPAFVAGRSGNNPILTSLKETIDRFNNIYSISESWSYDPQLAGSGLLRYTHEINSGISDGIIDVTLNGSIEGGFNTPFASLRSRYSGTNIFALASSGLSGFSSQSLNATELTASLTEDIFNNRIEFSHTYDNNPLPNPYLVSSITISKSKRGRNSASFAGTFKYRGACLCNSEAGWTTLENTVNSYGYHSAVQAKWTSHGMTSILSTQPSSKSITKNKNSCEISVDLTYDEISSALPAGLEYINVTLSVSPSIKQYEGQPVFQQGQWYITDLGHRSRTIYSLNGSARIADCTPQTQGLSTIKSHIDTLAGSTVVGENPIMLNGTLTEADSDKKLINFNFTWSAMGTEFKI